MFPSLFSVIPAYATYVYVSSFTNSFTWWINPSWIPKTSKSWKWTKDTAMSLRCTHESSLSPSLSYRRLKLPTFSLHFCCPDIPMQKVNKEINTIIKFLHDTPLITSPDSGLDSYWTELLPPVSDISTDEPASYVRRNYTPSNNLLEPASR